MTMSTTWRDARVVPDKYDDLRPLVALARLARNRVVEFDWWFTEDELRRLRVAAHYWGAPTVGRYKLFDARVLAAINAALGESNSAHRLKEAVNLQGLDYVVRCVPDAGGFRLVGHATFDILFAYGFPGFEPRPDVVARAGQDVLDRLTQSVAGLGWDLQLLKEERYRPVVSAIYGMSYRPAEPVAPSEPPREVHLDFQGPFALTEQPGVRCLFADPVAQTIGIYLWTVAVDGRERATYVGQTRRTFGQRMGEHVQGILCGAYAIQDPEALQRGVHTLLWAGDEGGKRWPATLPTFVARLPELAQGIREYLGVLRVHVAPLEGDVHLLSQVEGTLGRHFQRHPEQATHRFFSQGIKLPGAVAGERGVNLMVTSEGAVEGVPAGLNLRG
ncbi:MAG: hypothetical protein ACOYOB_19225 [Myxococcota bacterium]